MLLCAIAGAARRQPRAPGVDAVHRFGGAEMAVAAHQDMRVGEMAANALQHSLEDHRILGAGRTHGRAQYGRHQGAAEALENHQRQITGAAIVVVAECEWLLAMSLILRVVDVEHQHGRSGGVAGDELVHERTAEAENIPAPGRMFETGDGGSRCQCRLVVERGTARAKTKHRVVAQRSAIVAVLVAAGDLIDPLGQDVVLRMGDVAGVTSVGGGRQASCRLIS